MNLLLVVLGRKWSKGVGGLGGGIFRSVFFSCLRRVNLVVVCELVVFVMALGLGSGEDILFTVFGWIWEVRFI